MVALFVHVSDTDDPAGAVARPLGAAGPADWAGKAGARAVQRHAAPAAGAGADARAGRAWLSDPMTVASVARMSASFPCMIRPPEHDFASIESRGSVPPARQTGR